MNSKRDRGYVSDERICFAYQEILMIQAVRELRDEEIETLERLELTADTAFERRIRKTIGREVIRSSINHTARTLVMRTGVIILLLCVGLSMGLTTAFAVSGTFRAVVYELFTEEYEEYTVVEVRPKDGDMINIPDEWKGEYFLKYIPEGYVLKDIGHLFDDNCWVEYRNENDEWISFEESTEYASTNIDTENAEVWGENLNGGEAIVALKEKYVIVAWRQHDKMLMITKHGNNVAEALKIAENIIRIR